MQENGKPTVVLNFEEHGWHHSWNHQSVPGMNFEHSLMYGDEGERRKLHFFVGEIEPDLYFLREFSYNIQSFFIAEILPIELLSPNLPLPPEPDRDEYMARGGLFSLCGTSHPDRKLLHDSISRIKAPCSVQEVDHTQRRPLMDVMALQGRYMASLNLGGAGEKCFRSAEACWNSVPIMADVGMEYRVKWDDSNAIMLPTKDGRILLEESLNKIQACLDDKEGMWERMLNAHENAKRMNIDNYLAEINQEILERTK